MGKKQRTGAAPPKQGAWLATAPPKPVKLPAASSRSAWASFRRRVSLPKPIAGGMGLPHDSSDSESDSDSDHQDKSASNAKAAGTSTSTKARGAKHKKKLKAAAAVSG